MIRTRTTGAVHIARGQTRHRHAEQAVATLVAGALLTGCGTAHLPTQSSTPAGPPTPPQSRATPTTTTLPQGTAAARAVASTFPELDGYRWQEVPAAEWAQAWEVYSSDFHGTLAGGDARHVFDADGDFVGIMVVLTPTPQNRSTEALKAIFDRQVKQTSETYGLASVLEDPAHHVLMFADAAGQSNWYWVSGTEFVVLVAPDLDDDSEALFEVLSEHTL